MKANLYMFTLKYWDKNFTFVYNDKIASQIAIRFDRNDFSSQIFIS